LSHMTMVVLKVSRHGAEEPKDAASHQNKHTHNPTESAGREGQPSIASPNAARNPLGRLLHIGSVPGDKKKSYITRRIETVDAQERRSNVNDALEHVLSPPTKSLFRMRRGSMGSNPSGGAMEFSCLEDDEDDNSFSNDDLGKTKAVKKKKKKKAAAQEGEAAPRAEDEAQDGVQKVKKKKKKKAALGEEMFDMMEAPQFDLALEISKAPTSFESGFLSAMEQSTSEASLESDALNASADPLPTSPPPSVTKAKTSKVKSQQEQDDAMKSPPRKAPSGLPPKPSSSSKMVDRPPLPTSPTKRKRPSEASLSGVPESPTAASGSSGASEQEERKESGMRSPSKRTGTPKKSSSLRYKTSPTAEGNDTKAVPKKTAGIPQKSSSLRSTTDGRVNATPPKKKAGTPQRSSSLRTQTEEGAASKVPKKQAGIPKKSSSLRSKTSPINDKTATTSPVPNNRRSDSSLPMTSVGALPVKSHTRAVSCDSSSLTSTALAMQKVADSPISVKKISAVAGLSSTKPRVSPRKKSICSEKLTEELAVSKPSSSSKSLSAARDPAEASSVTETEACSQPDTKSRNPQSDSSAKTDPPCKEIATEMKNDPSEQGIPEIGTMELNDVDGSGSSRRRPSRRARPLGGSSSHSRSRSLPSGSSSSKPLQSTSESSLPMVRTTDSAPSPKRRSRSRSTRSSRTTDNPLLNADSSHSRSRSNSISFSGRSRRSASPSSLRLIKNRTRLSRSRSSGANPLEKLQTGMVGDTSSVDRTETQDSTGVKSRNTASVSDARSTSGARQQRRASLTQGPVPPI